MGSITSSGVVAHENLQQFGVALRLSPLAARRANPYFLVAGGFDRLTATASDSGLSASASQSGGYLGTGGGANLLVAPHWGLRPEFRWEHQQFAATTVGGPLATSSHFNSLTAPGSTAPTVQRTVRASGSYFPPPSAAANLNPSGTRWLPSTRST